MLTFVTSNHNKKITLYLNEESRIDKHAEKLAPMYMAGGHLMWYNFQ